MLYRKKPVVIEARLLTALSAAEIAEWCGGSVLKNEYDATYIEIYTLEGVMRASLDDYVIKGVNGEFYPCKPDIFEKTYEDA